MASDTPQPGASIIRKPEVLHRLGFSNTELYRRLKAGRFPKPVRLGRNSVGWLSSEIDAYIAARVAERDQREGASE